MGKKVKLSTKILCSVIIMSILCLILFLTALNTFVRDMLVEQAHDSFVSNNVIMVSQVDKWINEYRHLLEGMSLSLQQVDSERLYKLVYRFAAEHDEISQTWIGLDTEYTITSYTGELPDDWDLFTRPWYYGALAVNSETVVGMPFWSITEQKWVTYVSRHVLLYEDSGVVSFIITLETIFEMMNGFVIEDGGYVFLVGQNGDIISHPGFPHYLQQYDLINISDIPLYRGTFDSILNGEQFIPFETGDGIDTRILSQQLLAADWIMVSIVPLSIINESINSVIVVVLTTLTAILVVFPSLLVWYISVLIKGSISRSLIEFRDSSDSLATSGKLGCISDWDSSFGLNEVSREFDKNLTIFASIMDDLSRFSYEVGANGDVEYRIAKGKYEGSFEKMIEDINDFADRFADSIKKNIEQIEQMEVLEANSQAKSMFLASMSHEIRTPMNAILGITEIQLQKTTHSDEVREAFEKIYVSGDMLLGIINDILDLSKIEAGKMELIIEKYETASIFYDTAVLNSMRGEGKDIAFEISIEETMPAFLYGDELRIKQVLNNILSNAFKYTDEGTVRMSLYTEEDSQNPGGIILAITISDTGQGMTAEQVDKLFDSYSRFNLEANRFTEGTGLGMSITSNLIGLMGGTISVASEPGVGSSFIVRVPQKIAGNEKVGRETAQNLSEFRSDSRAQLKRAQVTQEPMPYGKVLIVDDVVMNIFVAQGLMSPYELQIDTAESGYVAIEKIKRGKEYDIVFMDHMMPQMDGIETTKRLREMGYAKPIVALTANALVGQANMFLSNGFDEFISKPIDIRQLNMVLNKLIRDKQPPEVLEAARTQGATESLIDDFFDDYMKSSGIFDKVREDFRQSQKNVVSEILNAVEAKDFKTACLLAHTLKGLAGLIGENGIVKLAGEAESAFRKGVMPGECIDALAVEMERVLGGM